MDILGGEVEAEPWMGRQLSAARGGGAFGKRGAPAACRCARTMVESMKMRPESHSPLHSPTKSFLNSDS